MSTISSQLLVSSSSLTQDVYKTFVRRSASQRELVFISRLSVLAVSLAAIALAFDRSNSILTLVSNAWAGFGAAFGPVILLSLYWRNMTRNGALAGMVTGAVTVLLWIYAPIDIDGQPLTAYLYEIVPGFGLAFATTVIVSLMDRHPSDSITERHDSVVALITGDTTLTTSSTR
jgi:Na+/proline symporter